jgi:hypothetical protein
VAFKPAENNHDVCDQETYSGDELGENVLELIDKIPHLSTGNKNYVGNWVFNTSQRRKERTVRHKTKVLLAEEADKMRSNDKNNEIG